MGLKNILHTGVLQLSVSTPIGLEQAKTLHGGPWVKRNLANSARGSIWYILIIQSRMVTEGGPRPKKCAIQVSYLSKIVSTSRFRIRERNTPKTIRATNSGYFSRVFSPFWHSEITVNILGDEYGSILIFTVLGFWPLNFVAVFGHFWEFLAFLGFWWRFGGIRSASAL